MEVCADDEGQRVVPGVFHHRERLAQEKTTWLCRLPRVILLVNVLRDDSLVANCSSVVEFEVKMMTLDGTSDRSLGGFIADVQHNLAAPLNSFPPCILAADAVFVHLIDHLHQTDDNQPIKMLLFAHSAWRQALVNIAAGGSTHSIAIQRTSLEAGLYGFLFVRDSHMAKHWRNREIDPNAEQAFRGNRKNPGGVTRARKLLLDEDPTLHADFKLIEDQLISFGGHPNYLAVQPGIEFKMLKDTSLGWMGFTYLGSQRDREIAWLFAVQTADVIMRVYCRLYPIRADLALMPARLLNLARLTQDLINQISSPDKE